MAQSESASDQLKQYLAQLAPQVRGRLLAELERLHLEGEDLPRLEELIASLRAELIAAGQSHDRLGNSGRYFFQPLEPVLVDRAPERANSGQIARGSLAPIWDILAEELLTTMAREYIEKADKAISVNNRPEADKLASAFRKKVLGYLQGTIRSADGVAILRQSLKKYTSSPAAFDDLAKTFTVLQQSEALAAFAAALPAKIKKLEGQAFTKVLQQLNALKAKNGDAVPFALTIIARRLDTPWQLVHLATKTVESKAPEAISATPFAIAVSMTLDQIDEKQLLLRVALRNNRIVIAKGILREIYAIEKALKSRIELGNSDWGNRLRDSMAAVAAALDAEVERSRAHVGGLSHVLESSALRPMLSLKERLGEAVRKGRDVLADILPA
ncbi:MAG: hypothetical protein U1E61_09740 [Bradyrhizobium sp.]|mgnify:CR=1 FL=1